MTRWIQPLTSSGTDGPLRLTIKLYGTLGRSFTGYDHANGLEVNIQKNATIQDLLVQLNLDSERLGMIYMDGQCLNKKSLLQDDSQIKIFQPIAGG